jgi:hypothetical protein
MSKDYKTMRYDNMVGEIDAQLDHLAGTIVSFLQTVDEEDALFTLVEKLCGHDLELMDKLCFAVDSYIISKDFESINIVPSESEYAH